MGEEGGGEERERDQDFYRASTFTEPLLLPLLRWTGGGSRRWRQANFIHTFKFTLFTATDDVQVDRRRQQKMEAAALNEEEVREAAQAKVMHTERRTVSGPLRVVGRGGGIEGGRAHGPSQCYAHGAADGVSRAGRRRMPLNNVSLRAARAGLVSTGIG